MLHPVKDGGFYVLCDCLVCFFRLVIRFEAREEEVGLCQRGGIFGSFFFSSPPV